MVDEVVVGVVAFYKVIRFGTYGHASRLSRRQEGSMKKSDARFQARLQARVDVGIGTPSFLSTQNIPVKLRDTGEVQPQGVDVDRTNL
jgi:hypothetical protein